MFLRPLRHPDSIQYSTKKELKMKINLCILAIGITIAAMGTQAAAQQWNPRPGWKDSYAVDGVCYCDWNGFDHGAD